MKKTCLLSLNFLLPLFAWGQISLAPTTVFSDANGIGTLYVSNSSSVPQEVNISFIFGYPGNDSIGNLLMVYDDILREKQSGLGDRIRTFPKSFILGPNQQQVVRFQIRPDRSKPAGMYFTRVKVISNPQTTDVETNTINEGISTQITLKLEQIIAAFYKSGDLSTGIDFTKISGQRVENYLSVVSEFTVTGNSPYLGSLQAEVKDSSGKLIATHQQTIALYYEGKRNFSIPIPEGISPGKYEVQLVFKTERSDIPSTDLVQATPIIRTLTVDF